MTRRTRTPVTWTEFEIEATAWSWSYSLSVNTEPRPFDPLPLSEFRQLRLMARLLSPNLKRCERVEVMLMPDRNLDLSRETSAVGGAGLHAGRLQVFLTIPLDVLPLVLSCLSAGRLPRISARSNAFRYNRGPIRDFGIDWIDPAMADADG